MSDSQAANHLRLAGFGERLKEAFSNIQNKEIARLLRVSNPAVTAYLKGRVPPAEKLIEIADFTGCNLHWLITGKGPKRIIEIATQKAELAKTVLFHCGKGGVGTSTIALLTAVGFATRGYKTLLVDNIYGSCTQNLFYQVIQGYEKDASINRMRVGGINGDPLGVSKFFTTPVSELDLISYHTRFQSILSHERIGHSGVMPSEVKENYSFVVIDAPSSSNPFHPTDLFKAHLLQEAKVFIPYQPYNSDSRNVKSTMKYINSARSYVPGIEFMGLFFNNYDPERPINIRLSREIESSLNGKLLQSVVHRSPDLWQMIPGQTGSFYQKKSKLVREVSALVTEIQERLEGVKPRQERSRKAS